MFTWSFDKERPLIKYSFNNTERPIEPSQKEPIFVHWLPSAQTTKIYRKLIKKSKVDEIDPSDEPAKKLKIVKKNSEILGGPGRKFELTQIVFETELGQEPETSGRPRTLRQHFSKDQTLNSSRKIHVQDVKSSLPSFAEFTKDLNLEQ